MIMWCAFCLVTKNSALQLILFPLLSSLGYIQASRRYTTAQYIAVDPAVRHRAMIFGRKATKVQYNNPCIHNSDILKSPIWWRKRNKCSRWFKNKNKKRPSRLKFMWNIWTRRRSLFSSSHLGPWLTPTLFEKPRRVFRRGRAALAATVCRRRRKIWGRKRVFLSSVAAENTVSRF